MPEPLEEMVPEAPITRCQGIGGSVLDGKNFKADDRSFLINNQNRKVGILPHFDQHVVNSWAFQSAFRYVLGKSMSNIFEHHDDDSE